MVRICSTGLLQSWLCRAMDAERRRSWKHLAGTGFRGKQEVPSRENEEERSVRTGLFCWEAMDAQGSHPVFQLCSRCKWLRGIGFPVSDTFTVAALKPVHRGHLSFHGSVHN